ncbi:MAG: DUF4399 domain-containing protein [candidate division NC10 bacterium]|nr:DUF4399 domain-containing protein [candidate division NC10 bacterium]
MVTQKKRFMVMAGIVGLVFVLAAFWVWAQAGPTLKITSPKSGESFPGDTVKITWESTGVKIVAAADAKSREEAHYHVLLDREDFRPGIEIPRGMEKEGIYHSAATSLELKGLKPGAHKAIVVLSYNNHVPWEPLVTAKVTFTTGGEK